MSNVSKGAGFIFGTNSTTNTSWGAPGSYFIQNRSFSPKATKYSVADGNGITRGNVYYDQVQVATFDFIVASNTTIPTIAIGDTQALADATFTQLAGNNWTVEDVDYKNTNKDAVAVSITLWQYQF